MADLDRLLQSQDVMEGLDFPSSSERHLDSSGSLASHAVPPSSGSPGPGSPLKAAGEHAHLLPDFDQQLGRLGSFGLPDQPQPQPQPQPQTSGPQQRLLGLPDPPHWLLPLAAPQPGPAAFHQQQPTHWQPPAPLKQEWAPHQQQQPPQPQPQQSRQHQPRQQQVQQDEDDDEEQQQQQAQQDSPQGSPSQQRAQSKALATVSARERSKLAMRKYRARLKARAASAPRRCMCMSAVLAQRPPVLAAEQAVCRAS